MGQGSALPSETLQQRFLHCRVRQGQLGSCRPETQTVRCRQSVRRRSWDSATYKTRGFLHAGRMQRTLWETALLGVLKAGVLRRHRRGQLADGWEEHRPASFPSPTQKLLRSLSRGEGPGSCG